MTTRIGAYARISFDWEGKALGVKRQQADCRKLASLRHWEVAEYYTDNNVSAYREGVERPEFERLLRDLENGTIDGVVAYDLDRIARRPSDLERLIRIYNSEHRQMAFATVQGDIDLSTSNGRAMARVMVAFANKSSEDTSRRLKRKNLEKAENGLPHGSRRPFGYNKDRMTLHPVEAPIVRQIGERFLAGDSYRTIALWLESEGIKTTTGRQWLPITVRNLLQRPVYGGLRVYEGKTYKGVWQPVFTPAEWDKVQALVKLRRHRAGDRPQARRYLLTGYLVCGKCGNYLNGENSTLHAYSTTPRHIAVEVKRVAGIDAVEQLSRYLEFLNRDPLLAPVGGILAAQTIKPQARTLAEARGIRCQVLDYDEMRGVESGQPRLF